MTTFDNKDVFGHVNVQGIHNMAAYGSDSDRLMGTVLEASLRSDKRQGAIVPPVIDGEPNSDEERDRLVSELLKSFLGQLGGIRIHGGDLETEDGESTGKAGVLVSVVLNVRKSLLDAPPPASGEQSAGAAPG